jgi:hypothetical protein
VSAASCDAACLILELALRPYSRPRRPAYFWSPSGRLSLELLRWPTGTSTF